MNEFNWVIYAILQQYVKDSLLGVGAIKGAPCEILSIVDGTGEHLGEHTINFQWTASDNTTRTGNLILKDGKSITNVEIITDLTDGKPHLIEFLSDGTALDAGIVDTGAGHEIIDSEGVALPKRRKLRINNATISDDETNDETVITPSGSGSTIWHGTKAEFEAALRNGELTEGMDFMITDDYNDYSGSSSGGSAELTDDLSVNTAVGGINSGKLYEAGTSLEEIFRNMLAPVKYPSFSAPTATLSATGAKILERGATLNTTMTVSFNRGSISPAYGTDGYRAGMATGYSLNGGSLQSSNAFPVTIDDSELTYRASVEYSAGAQPKDSAGNNYGTALPAGTINTNTITYEFVDALWANTSNIGTVSKLSLVSKGSGTYRFDFPAQTVANPEVFDVPASWNVIAIETLNPLSNTWGNCTGEFDTSTITHDDISGNPVDYTRFRDNRGYNAGARAVRIRFN